MQIQEHPVHDAVEGVEHPAPHGGGHDDRRRPGHDERPAHEPTPREACVEELGERQRDDHRDGDHPEHPDEGAREHPWQLRVGEQRPVVVDSRETLGDAGDADLQQRTSGPSRWPATGRRAKMSRSAGPIHGSGPRESRRRRRGRWAPEPAGAGSRVDDRVSHPLPPRKRSWGPRPTGPGSPQVYVRVSGSGSYCPVATAWIWSSTDFGSAPWTAVPMVVWMAPLVASQLAWSLG